VLTPAQCAVAQPRSYIIKGMVSAGDNGLIFGAPGCGKSVILPHIAYAVAQGRDVLGRRVRRGPVAYLAAEDGIGMQHRVAALRALHGEAEGFYLLPDPVDLGDPAARAAVRTFCEARGVILLCVDTLARGFPQADENDGGPLGMGGVVAALRDLTSPVRAVLAAHHQPKGGSTPRGHGKLEGDADLTAWVQGEPGQPKLATIQKNRSGPSGATFGFRVVPHRLGEDEDGDALTAPVAEVDDTPAAPRGKAAALADAHALLLRELQNLGAEGAGETGQPMPDMPPVRFFGRDALRARLIAAGWFPEPELLPSPLPNGRVLTDAGYKRENRALEALKRKGFAAFTRAAVWTV
jgi:hypothetical protein